MPKLWVSMPTARYCSDIGSLPATLRRSDARSKLLQTYFLQLFPMISNAFCRQLRAWMSTWNRRMPSMAWMKNNKKKQPRPQLWSEQALLGRDGPRPKPIGLVSCGGRTVRRVRYFCPSRRLTSAFVVTHGQVLCEGAGWSRSRIWKRIRWMNLVDSSPNSLLATADLGLDTQRHQCEAKLCRIVEAKGQGVSIKPHSRKHTAWIKRVPLKVVIWTGRVAASLFVPNQPI